MVIMWKVAMDPTKEKNRVGWVNLLMTTLTYPIFCLTWCLGGDVFSVISNRDEFIFETCLSLFLKTVAISYTLTEVEFDKWSEVPQAIFTVCRGVLYNIMNNRH
jgi:hypothetical protein